MNILHKEPLVMTIDDFITDKECEHFISLSNNNLVNARVVGNKTPIATKGRNNRNCWIAHNHDEITKRVGEKIAKLVEMPLENAEKYQIIHYEKDQHYNYHFDAFPIDDSDKSKTFMRLGGQRMKTALVYLNEVEEGGETSFSKLKLNVKPKKGRIIIFENCYKKSNERHPLSLHAGLKVKHGEKYAFNLWFREIASNKIYDRTLIRPHNV